MFTLPFKIIQKYLLEITELKNVDWYLSQYNRTDKSAMLLTSPGAYIEFHPMPTESMGQGIQKAEGSVSIHLVTDSVLSTGQRMNSDQITDHASIFNEIYKKLDGRKGMLSDEVNLGLSDDVIIFNTLSRNQVTPSHDLKSKIISIQRFKACFFDYSKNKTYTKLVTNLEVNTV